MSTFRLSALVIVLVAGGCGDDETGARDAAPDAPVDAPVGEGDGAPLPSCDPAAIIDLDGVATTSSGVKEALYHGSTAGADSSLEPPAVCSDGPGGGRERVHHFTAPAGDRFRVTASTTETDTPPELDTVVYVRSVCLDPASGLACNDDSALPSTRPLASLLQAEVAGGQSMFVVVDGYDPYQVGPYELRVRAIPALATGSMCDPTGVMNACRSGDICTSAGGPPPHCAPGTPPVLTQAVPQVLENGRSVRVIAAGSDVDADALALHVDFLDGAGGVLASAERGLGTAAMGQQSFGPLVAYEQDGLVDRYPTIATARAWLIDAAGLTSAAMDVALAPVTLRDLSQACDPAGLSDLCRGELVCTGACGIPAAASSACAQASTVTASTTLAGTLNPTTGTFESSCAYARGFDDRVFRVTLSAPSDLVVTTDVDPSGVNLDTVVYVRTSCTDPATQLGCNDDLAPTLPHSRLELHDLAAGDYFVFVDGSRLGAGLVPSGAFGLAIEIIPIVGAGQPCGATMDGGLPVGRCAAGLSCTNGVCM